MECGESSILVPNFGPSDSRRPEVARLARLVRLDPGRTSAIDRTARRRRHREAFRDQRSATQGVIGTD